MYPTPPASALFSLFWIVAKARNRTCSLLSEMPPSSSSRPFSLPPPFLRLDVAKTRDDKTDLFFFDDVGEQPTRVDMPRREGVLSLACSPYGPLLLFLCPTGEIYYREEVGVLSRASCCSCCYEINDQTTRYDTETECAVQFVFEVRVAHVRDESSLCLVVAAVSR